MRIALLCAIEQYIRRARVFADAGAMPGSGSAEQR
jgi:hypothetical protein